MIKDDDIMDNNLNVKILESYVEIDKIHDEINNKMFNFITKANDLVDLSEDDYQIEKSLLLNKISLKGYVLDSELCLQLHENNVIDFDNDSVGYLELNEKLELKAVVCWDGDDDEDGSQKEIPPHQDDECKEDVTSPTNQHGNGGYR